MLLLFTCHQFSSPVATEDPKFGSDQWSEEKVVQYSCPGSLSYTSAAGLAAMLTSSLCAIQSKEVQLHHYMPLDLPLLWAVPAAPSVIRHEERFELASQTPCWLCTTCPFSSSLETFDQNFFEKQWVWNSTVPMLESVFRVESHCLSFSILSGSSTVMVPAFSHFVAWPFPWLLEKHLIHSFFSSLLSICDKLPLRVHWVYSLLTSKDSQNSCFLSYGSTPFSLSFSKFLCYFITQAAKPSISF